MIAKWHVNVNGGWTIVPETLAIEIEKLYYKYRYDFNKFATLNVAELNIQYCNKIELNTNDVVWDFFAVDINGIKRRLWKKITSFDQYDC